MQGWGRASCCWWTSRLPTPCASSHHPWLCCAGVAINKHRQVHEVTCCRLVSIPCCSASLNWSRRWRSSPVTLGTCNPTYPRRHSRVTFLWTLHYLDRIVHTGAVGTILTDFTLSLYSLSPCLVLSTSHTGGPSWSVHTSMFLSLSTRSLSRPCHTIYPSPRWTHLYTIYQKISHYVIHLVWYFTYPILLLPIDTILSLSMGILSLDCPLVVIPSVLWGSLPQLSGLMILRLTLNSPCPGL